MSTIGGARTLHMEAEIGSLEDGKKADLIVLGLDAPNAVPLYDSILRLCVLKAEDVRTVIIGGRVVMQHRHVLTLDQAAIVSRADAYADVVKKSLNLADCPPGAATCGPGE